MAMPKRKPGQNALEDLRADVVKQGKDIVKLKARVFDAEQRLAKAETALGTIAKSGMPSNVEREEPVTAEDVLDETQQPETE